MFLKMSLHRDNGTKLWDMRFTPAGPMVWKNYDELIERGISLKGLTVLPDIEVVPMNETTIVKEEDHED